MCLLSYYNDFLCIFSWGKRCENIMVVKDSGKEVGVIGL